MIRSDQYLMDHLAHLEKVIEKHAEKTYTKKFLIYRDGYLYTGTDDISDVRKLVPDLVNNGLYTFVFNTKTFGEGSFKKRKLEKHV